MAYSRLVSEKTFEKIWQFWINKEGERAAEKAIDVCLKSGEDAKKIIEACEAYRLENLGKDPEFTYKLSNFILQDHWKDVSDSISVEALKKLHDDSVTLIKEWNNTCKPHWCKVVDIESKVPVVMKALKDKAFKENWSKALKKASGIFKYKFRDGDGRQKIILSLRWFTTVDCTKHTVLKIIEGEYGHEEKEERKIVVESKPIDYDARNEAAREFAKMMQPLGFNITEKKKEEDKQKKEIVISEEAKQIASLMSGHLGKKPKQSNENISQAGDSAKEIAEQIKNSIRDSTGKTSNSDDEFELY